MDLDTIPNLLSEQRDAAPEDVQHYYLQFEDFWERKLWHELTDILVEYFERPESASQRIPLYTGFISTFDQKINQLKLVTLGLSASTQCKGGTSAAPMSRSQSADPPAVDDQERLTFLQTLADKVNKPASQDAYVYATVAVAEIQLRLQDYEGARKKLDECEGILDTFDSVETVVHASFYRVNAEYYKVRSQSSHSLPSATKQPN